MVNKMKYLIYTLFISLPVHSEIQRNDISPGGIFYDANEKYNNTLIKQHNYESLSMIRRTDNSVNQYPVSNKDINHSGEALNVQVNELSKKCEEASSEYSTSGNKVYATNIVIDGCMKNVYKVANNKKSLIEKFIPYIVYLRSKNDVCTGLLVNSTTILTAMHCSVDIAYFSTGESREINPKNRTACTSKNYCDYVTLKIDKVNLPPLDFEWRNAVENDQLFIAGVSIPDLTKAPKQYTKDIIFANDDASNDNCHAVVSDENCIIHLCTVLRGFSGSPILNIKKSNAENKIIISGLHISSSETLINLLCKKNQDKLLANYGMSANNITYTGK